MRLLIQGFHYRTSGSATPFDAFNKVFDNIESLQGQRLEVGCRGYAVFFKEIGFDFAEVAFEFEDGVEAVRLGKGEKQTLRHSRALLGVEVELMLE